jgi:magnesium-transporting ATPase (P-type)
MNEAILTGESIPVVKEPLDYNQFSFIPEKKNTIYSGTFCLRSYGETANDCAVGLVY